MYQLNCLDLTERTLRVCVAIGTTSMEMISLIGMETYWTTLQNSQGPGGINICTVSS